MAVTINADNGAVSGSSGLKYSADSTGVLALQTNGTTAVSVSTGQVVTLTQPLPVASGGTGTTSTTFTNLTTNVTGTLPVANGGTGATTSTGSGAVVLGTSPTLTTPNINSAQIPTVSGTAPLYMCRAWVNFNGTANSNLSGTYARTSPSTTLTVTATSHGLIAGNSVNLDFTTGTGLDGTYTVVTVADANTFTITTVASTTTSGNVTLLRNTIRGSGNVSSITDNGTGQYTVNFTTDMPSNYAVQISGVRPDNANTFVVYSITNFPTSSTSSVQVRCINTTFSVVDAEYFFVTAFG